MSLFRPRVFGGVATGLRRERIEASPRFRQGQFHNTDPLAAPLSDQTLGQRLTMIGDFMFGGRRRRPAAALPLLDPRQTWRQPASTGLRVTWLGHSTVLLEIDGVRVLTDPVWSERASPVSFAGPRRFHPVPVTLDALPALDAVIISHDHYDHLDYRTVCALAGANVPFYTSLGVGAHLEAWGIAPSRIVELDWWEEAVLPGSSLGIRATPSRHFSGRGAGANLTAWSSWVLRADRHRVFFSGDTGMTGELADIGQRCGPFDLVMLEVGAFHPAWAEIHLGPDHALSAHRMLGGRTLLPIHWGTFDLGLHPWQQPAERLVHLVDEAKVHMVTPRLGAPIEPSRIERPEPWWREVYDPASARALPEPTAAMAVTRE